MASHTSYVRREPIGVSAAVTPWNYPAMMAVWKFAPALAAGNTMVLKPSTRRRQSTLFLAELMAEHLPPGVFNVICGDRDTGRQLGRPQDAGDGLDHRQRARRDRSGDGSRRRPEACPPGARRQGAGHRLRRRRRRSAAAGELPSAATSTPARTAPPRRGSSPASGARRLRRPARRRAPADEDGRNRRRRRGLRTAQQRVPARKCLRLHRANAPGHAEIARRRPRVGREASSSRRRSSTGCARTTR